MYSAVPHGVRRTCSAYDKGFALLTIYLNMTWSSGVCHPKWLVTEVIRTIGRRPQSDRIFFWLIYGRALQGTAPYVAPL